MKQIYWQITVAICSVIIVTCAVIAYKLDRLDPVVYTDNGVVVESDAPLTNSIMNVYNRYGDQMMCFEGYGEPRVYQTGSQVVYDTPAGKVYVVGMPVITYPDKECAW